MKYTLAFCFLILIKIGLISIAHAQTKPNATEEDLNSYFNDEILLHVRSLQDIGEQSPFTLEDIFIRYYKGLELIEQVDDSLKLKFYDDFALRLGESRLFDEAIILSKKGADLALEYPTNLDVRFFYNHLVHNYLELKKHDSVTWAIKQVIKANATMHTSFAGLGSFNDLGYHYYLNLKKYDSALYYFNKRKGHPMSVFDGTLTLNWSINDNIALVYMEQKKYIEAKALFKENYEHYSNNRKGYLWRERWLRAGLQYAQTEIILGNHKSAQRILTEVENHFKGLKDYKASPKEYFASKLLLLKIKQQYANAIGNSQWASELEKANFTLKDSLTANQSEQLLQDAYLLHKIGLRNAKNLLEKEKALNAIEKQNLALDLKAKSTKIYWAGAMGILLAITVFGYFYFRRIRKYDEQKSKMQAEYAQNLIKAQEKERIRLSRELHDGVGQKMMLLAKKLKLYETKEVDTLAKESLTELRSVARGLHPSILTRLGLNAAIIRLIDEFDAHSDSFFTHDIDSVEAYLSAENQLHLYRIIQEAISNSLKHAKANAIEVKLNESKDSILLEINDNGQGFDVIEKLNNSTSLGMKTLRERSRIINGVLNIVSSASSGTQLSLLIPK
ncbi:MAG: sensor histidine kinase [Gilvibacter sp.]